MRSALAIILALAVFALPCLAQEPTPKPETPKPEVAKPETPKTEAKAPDTTPTEPLPSLDQILDKYVETLGGKAAIEKITTRQISGSFEIPAMGASGTLKGYTKAPNKSLMVIDVPGFGVIQQGFDGSAAWADDPMGGLRDITGDELVTTKRDVDFYREAHLKDLFPKMTVKSKEKVGEGEAYLVEATPPDGKSEKLYFDTKSGLLVRHDAERTSPQGAALVESYFEDYKAVDGVKVPFTMKRVMPAFAMTIKFEEVKNNVEIEDARFAKPVPKPEPKPESKPTPK
jgi:hypothetical protein